MLLDRCFIIGLDGPHGSGKTSLAYALAGYANAAGVRAACVPEVIRRSPFFLSALFGQGPPIGSWAEIHAMAFQVSEELTLARDFDLLVCDRTILSALAYWAVRDPHPVAFEAELFDACEAFCRSYVNAYDAIFYLAADRAETAGHDQFRDADLVAVDQDFRLQVDRASRDVFTRMGRTLVELPMTLSVEESVTWIVEHLPAQSGLHGSESG